LKYRNHFTELENIIKIIRGRKHKVFSDFISNTTTENIYSHLLDDSQIG